VDNQNTSSFHTAKTRTRLWLDDLGKARVVHGPRPALGTASKRMHDRVAQHGVHGHVLGGTDGQLVIDQSQKLALQKVEFTARHYGTTRHDMTITLAKWSASSRVKQTEPRQNEMQTNGPPPTEAQSTFLYTKSSKNLAEHIVLRHTRKTRRAKQTAPCQDKPLITQGITSSAAADEW